MRLLMIVNVDWFFLSHRLPIALEAMRAGYEVHIATTLTQGREQLERYGFTVHSLDVDRSGASPAGLIRLFLALLQLFWALRPQLVHLVTIKPVLVGGVAARFSPVGAVVYAVSGLGHVFVAEGFGGRIRRQFAKAWYKFVLGAKNMRIIFQNPDDRRQIVSIACLRNEQIVMIPGSGVDLSEYRNTPLPDGAPIILMAARLLGTKGVREFVTAARQLRLDGVRARFWLVGALDLANPASIQHKELEDWAKQGDVEILGHIKNISELMSQAYLVVLPSYYGEGLPKVLIEAAACGRAIITTDMPGCRDAIEPGLTGTLVPVKDAVCLANSIKWLIEDRAVCQAMGIAGRKRAEQMFDLKVVINKHLEIYHTLMGG